MTDLTCARCGEAGTPLAAPPLPNELGHRIFDSVCQSCWQQWLKEQTAIINHYGLNLLDPKAKTLLMEKTESFFFGAQQS